ncbi:MAG: carbohydrate ABC transporter permease [Proteobacteria bacterium]|nr:carbohydrate ABC transporter permease [Pseudomonadota bacterium]
MARIGTSSVTKLAFVHMLLVFACAIASFPIFRVIAISFRNTDTVSSQGQKQFPAPGVASLLDYLGFFTDAIMPTDLIEAFKASETKNQPSSQESIDTPSAQADDPFAELDKESKLTPVRHWYSNYAELFSQHMFLQWIYNSLVIALSASLIGVLLAASAAYAFARFAFPGKRYAEGFMFMTQMIPAPLMIIPVYLVIKSLNLGNSYAGLVTAMSVTTLPFSIMVLKGYFETIPKSLEEAARVDGCSAASAFFRILLPLSTPALAIAFLFAFTYAWSEFLLASTLIDDVSLRPWTLGLMEFSGSYDARWGLFAAGSVVIALPSMALFLYSSKYVISGLTVGSVKG